MVSRVEPLAGLPDKSYNVGFPAFGGKPALLLKLHYYNIL